MRARDLFLHGALAAIAWTPSLSQSSPWPAPRFGIIGGANLATLTGSYGDNTSSRTGFSGGVMAALPVARSFMIQPELMFTMKGANSNSTTSWTARIAYVELPVLARFEVPAFGSLKPFVYGGPGFAYRTSCTLQGRATIEIDCDSIARQAALVEPGGAKFSRKDVDGIIGGGLAFDVGGRTVTVGVRYDVGFVKLMTNINSENRVLSFMGTLEWPFHK
jgi:outer membrane protein with beta-barrel domain